MYIYSDDESEGQQPKSRRRRGRLSRSSFYVDDIDKMKVIYIPAQRIVAMHSLSNQLLLGNECTSDYYSVTG